MKQDNTAGSDADDGREAVQAGWSDKDFNYQKPYEQGPTDAKGAGKCNEEHS